MKHLSDEYVEIDDHHHTGAGISFDVDFGHFELWSTVDRLLT